MSRPRPYRRAQWGDRQALIQKAHLAPAALKIDNDTRRDIQRAQTGKDSCAAMTVAELRKLLGHYETLGWKPRRPQGPPRGAVDRLSPEQESMIRALWLELRDIGELADPSPSALNHWVQRQTQRFRRGGIAVVAWLTPEQASALIEDLKHWFYRVRLQRAAEEIVALGVNPVPHDKAREIADKWGLGGVTNLQRRLEKKGAAVVILDHPDDVAAEAPRETRRNGASSGRSEP